MALRKAVKGAFYKGTGVDYALSGKAPAAKGVHVQLAAETAVRVAAAGPGEDEGKVRGVGAFQLRVHAGVDNGVAPSYHTALFVEHGPIQRVQGRADQLLDRAGIDPGVAVEGKNIIHAAESVPVPCDGQLGA